jgi:hypothetical protein
MTKSIIEQHQELLKKMNGQTVEAGWFETARYQAGKGVPQKMVGVPVARIAKINEFGATIKRGKKIIRIPARPFMRLATMNFKDKHTAIMQSLSKKIMRGQLKPEQALAQIGMFMEGLIVDSIKSGPWKRNSPATIAKKGFDKPLIDTAQMWQAVTSKVVKSK